MKVTFILTVIGALGTVKLGLLKWLDDLETRGWVETIQATTLLTSARILKRVLETWGESERPLANADVENTQGVNYNNSNNAKKEVPVV